MDGDAAHQEHRERTEREAAADQGSDRQARREASGERRDDEGEQAERQEPHAGLQRREAEDVLEVERDVEEHREQRRRDRERRDLRADERGRRNSARSIIVTRSVAWVTTKSTSRTTAATKRAMITVLVQPCLLPSIRPRIRQSSPPVSVTRPGGSRRACSGSFDSCSFAEPRMTAPTPIGMLTRKIQRHDSQEVSMPPASGPTATAAPIVAPQMPNAVPRSRPWNSCDRRASAVANISAPPRPWTPRAMIRNRGSFEAPQAAEATVKSTTPIRKSRLRPYRSASAPAGQHAGREAERVRVHDPLEIGEIRLERPLDRGQRDVHDRDVEQEHEGRDAHRHQRPPLPLHRPNIDRPGPAAAAGAPPTLG